MIWIGSGTLPCSWERLFNQRNTCLGSATQQRPEEQPSWSTRTFSTPRTPATISQASMSAIGWLLSLIISGSCSIIRIRLKQSPSITIYLQAVLNFDPQGYVNLVVFYAHDFLAFRHLRPKPSLTLICIIN